MGFAYWRWKLYQRRCAEHRRKFAERRLGCARIRRRSGKAAGDRVIQFVSGRRRWSFAERVPLIWPRFIDHGDGTFTDTMTGLTWLKQASCIQGDWATAVATVRSLATGQCGLTDGSAPAHGECPTVMRCRAWQTETRITKPTILISHSGIRISRSSRIRFLSTSLATSTTGRRRPMPPTRTRRGPFSVAISAFTMCRSRGRLHAGGAMMGGITDRRRCSRLCWSRVRSGRLGSACFDAVKWRGTCLVVSAAARV